MLSGFRAFGLSGLCLFPSVRLAVAVRALHPSCRHYTRFVPAAAARNDEIALFAPKRLPMERYRKDAYTLRTSPRRPRPASTRRFAFARRPRQGFGALRHSQKASLSPRGAGFALARLGFALVCALRHGFALPCCPVAGLRYSVPRCFMPFASLKMTKLIKKYIV